MQNQLMFEFETDDQKAGFRLHRLEVWNWGTFHNRIWTIEPAGGTSLLTGANGSGKSTLVDAILTLLVPNVKRTYNQASGSDRRKERDERTYVLGAYGKVKSGDGSASKTQYLRTKDDYSVLLAQFYNEGYKKRVTLAQVFWIQDGAVRKFFVLAREELQIEQHFSNFSSISELKKRLRAMPNVDVFDQFGEYGRQVRKTFGFRSEKALELFNQTVAIKEIGDLNDFVRTHMLDRTDVHEKIDQLRANYENLTRSHDAMLKAQRQLAQLKPLIAGVARYEDSQKGIQELEWCVEAVPAYFAQRKMALLDEAATQCEQQMTEVRHRLEETVQQLEDLRKEQRDLEIAISTDAAGQRMRELEQEIRRLEEKLERKHKLAEEYTNLAQILDIEPGDDEHAFNVSRQRGSTLKREIDAKLEKLGAELLEHQIERRKLSERCQGLRQELQSLEHRKSQIPYENLQIRNRILKDLNIPENEIPFVGELLKVRDEESEWEGSLERLLHSLGLRLLVPEKHYRAVSQYVNKTYLGGRIVFHRVGERRLYSVGQTPDDDAVVHKLEIKQGTEFHDWIRNELVLRYDYICCDNMERFQKESRAITKTGLTKSGNARHEKDDRHTLNDRRRFILGWDNQDKIRAIENELSGRERELEANGKNLHEIDTRKRQLTLQRERLQDFLRFDSFPALDWQQDDAEVRRLKEQKSELEQSSDRLKQLREQLATLTIRTAEKDATRRSVEREVNNIDRDIHDYRKQFRDCETRLSIFPPEEVRLYTPHIDARIRDKSLTLSDVDLWERQEQQYYRERVDQEKAELHRLENMIEKSMLNYKRDYPVETSNVDASVEAIGEFRSMLEKVEWEDLPRHEQRFKGLLNEKVIADISFFKSALERQVEDIKGNIEELNRSLRSIDYTPSTFIQLSFEVNRDPEILDFRNTLKACLSDVGTPQPPEAGEESLARIKALIERFESEERWTAKVTDVRNWMSFSASERYKEDNSEKHYYSDSSGKSGGQKAKLAYTILASAIAYQFGLDYGETRSRSFRFVVVDEAFSKSDEANARYAMELFKRLNLQLLVVTPPKSNDIRIVEPYIGACHYVTNNQDENQSKVYNLNIREYYEKRKILMQQAVHD